MTPGVRQKQRKPGVSSSMIVGVICAMLGAFGGCTFQFLNDMGGARYGGPDYLLSGIGIGLAVGLVMAFLVRFFDQNT
jgi:hypothetical protein